VDGEGFVVGEEVGEDVDGEGFVVGEEVGEDVREEVGDIAVVVG